jgi:glycosyltransferase involved in cell wall biosynthesis
VPSADALVVYDWSTALSAESLPAECGRRFYLVQAEESMCGAPAELVAASMRLPYCRIVISGWLKRTLPERYGVAAEGPIVNGVDFHSFHDMGWSPARLHTIGMVYASPPYKGSANGLRAFALAKQQFADLRMVLFGRDLPAFRMPQGVRFHYDPPQRELRPLYCSCGIWLLPSLVEGGGMPAQEAMACGCALVTTDVGAVRDFAQEGRNVLIVPPGDIEAMASAIVSLLRDEQLQRRIAACAAADIRAWSWERAAAQLEAIFQRHIGAA